ncbi:MAG: ABC transporter ATP-binding protein [Myxococcota bacterium]
MIEVQGLTKRYGETVAIDDVSFQVARGEVVGFLGPNGAGKSTTMRIIAGSLGASAGVARVGGLDVADNPRGVQALLGYAPEVPPVYTNMSVRDYVTFAATLKGVDDVAAATKKALGRVGLDKVSHRLIEHLSKGYRQRVGLAQALVHDPKVLVLDEPTSGLDPAQRVEIRNLLAELASGDRTVVLSTHVLGEIEAICSRVIIINRGRIVAQDELSRLSAVGRAVKVELARPGAEALAALQRIPGAISVEQFDERYVVRGEGDLREAVSQAAVPFGLLEMAGRERLEDIYLRLTTGGAS